MEAQTILGAVEIINETGNLQLQIEIENFIKMLEAKYGR